MPIRPQQLEIFRRANGREPFTRWLAGIEPMPDRQRILDRLNRVRCGLFGDARPVGDGVLELRMHHGPGYRIYFARRDPTNVVVLLGGTKATQRRDIAQARLFWREYEREQPR
jgi:putative addiction module killer protein